MKPFLTDYFNYFAGIWKKIGISQRISLVIIVMLVIGLFGGIIFISSKPDFALLYARLEPSDAALIVEKLRDMKLPYKLKNGGSAVYVSGDKVYDLRLEFAKEGIPKGKGIGFEIFDKTNFGITDFVQKMNYVRAIQGEISRSISQIEEVIGARVHIVIPQSELFEENQKETTSSIALTLKPGSVLDDEQVNAIRFLTASAVEGLDPKNITIIDQYGNVLSKNSADGDIGTLTDNQLQLKRNVEQYLGTKVQSMLERVLGVNNAIVRVNTELNFEQVEITEEKYDPESAVVRSEQIVSEKSSGKTNGSTVVGTATNIDNEKAASGGEESNKQKESIKNTYEIDRRLQKMIQSVGGIEKLSAAVFIKKVRDADGNYVDRSKKDIEQLEDIIKSAIGYSEKRNDSVIVRETIFNEEFIERQKKEIVAVRKRELIISIVKNSSMVVIVIFLLIIFKGMVKKVKLEESAVKAISEVNRGAGQDDSDEIVLDELPTADMELRKKSLIYQKAINKLVNDTPDNVVQILKGWLADSK